MATALYMPEGSPATAFPHWGAISTQLSVVGAVGLVPEAVVEYTAEVVIILIFIPFHLKRRNRICYN